MRTVSQILEDPQPGDLIAKGVPGEIGYTVRLVTIRSGAIVGFRVAGNAVTGNQLRGSGRREKANVGTVLSWKRGLRATCGARLPDDRDADAVSVLSAIKE